MLTTHLQYSMDNTLQGVVTWLVQMEYSEVTLS